jgi:hypothetical protein
MHFAKVCIALLRNFAQILKLTARFGTHVSALRQTKLGVTPDSLRYAPIVFSGQLDNDGANAMRLGRRQ